MTTHLDLCYKLVFYCIYFIGTDQYREGDEKHANIGKYNPSFMGVSLMPTGMSVLMSMLIKYHNLVQLTSI